MFYLCKREITLILLLFAGIDCTEDNDEGDVPGHNKFSDSSYGIYKVFVNSKKDADLLTDLANNKIIYPMKKTAFNWKVLVRANHEHYFQRRLIEYKINYIVIQTSLEDTMDLNRANIGVFDEEYGDQQQGKGSISLYETNPNSGNRKCFPTSPNCIPNREPIEPPKCLPTSPNCIPNREPPQPPPCFPTSPNCIPNRDPPPPCFPTNPNCIPNLPMNSYYPNIPAYPWPHPNVLLPPGNYFYCYLTGGCIPLPPPPLYSYTSQTQQKPNLQNHPYPFEYPNKQTGKTQL